MENLCSQKTIYPLDCALGVDNLPFKITTEMMLDIAYIAVKMKSYQEAEDFLERIKKIRVNDDTIRGVTNYVGNIVYQNDCQLANEAIQLLDQAKIPYNQNREGVLYIETDGTAVNTRTRDANGSSWRENKLGLVFSSDHIHEWENIRGESQHMILKREYISLIGETEEFKKHLFALALRNGLGEYKETVLLSDGATWIRNMKAELFPDAQQILDKFHAFENVHGFSKVIFRDDNKAKEWAEEICAMLESGQTEKMFRKLEKYKDVQVPGGTVNIYTYLKNNKDNIDYPQYKARGYFVGSGAIESGNKIVLQNRHKLAGMRWNTESAQMMLSLKSKMESGMWDSYVVPLVQKTMKQ